MLNAIVDPIVQVWGEIQASDVVLTLASVSIGLLASAYYFRKSRNTTELSCSSISSRMLSKKTDGLVLSFKGKKVANPHKDRIVVWNSGNKTIYKRQLQTSDPAGFELDGANLLECSLVSVTRDAIRANVQIEQSRRFAKVDFDFLDPADGFAFEVVYDFVNDAKEFAYNGGLKPVGTIIEMPAGVLYRGRSFEIPRGYTTSAVVSFLAILSFALSYSMVAYSWESVSSGIGRIFLGIVTLLFVWISFQIAKQAWKAFPRYIIPKGIDPYGR